MQHLYVHLEWFHDGPTGADATVDAVRAAGPLAVDETVHMLAGANAVAGIDGEAEVHFTVGVADGSLAAFADAVRGAGWRVKYATVIPSELARASFDEILAHEDARLGIDAA